MSLSLDSTDPGPHLQRAMWCGAIPLLTGVSVFLLWQIDHSPVFAVAGMMVVIAGIFSVLLGVFSLQQFRRYAKFDPSFSAKKITASTFLIGALLLSNFPVAATCVAFSGIAESSYVVIIQNDSGLPLTNIRLEASAETKSLDTILPGGTALCTFKEIGEWDLTLHAMHGNQVVDLVLDEYTMNLDTMRRVTLLPDGNFRIQ